MLAAGIVFSEFTASWLLLASWSPVLPALDRSATLGYRHAAAELPPECPR
jgi:hypothetical protein